MTTAARERRDKISVSVDPALLEEIDSFIQQHPTVTRSAIIDQALRLWRAQQREEALIRQYTTPLTPEQQDEQEAWHGIYRAAAQEVLEDADDRYEV
ncbi:MAG TPA: ribbon-helix-helix domain-containing protein [Chloroflexota bacterium]|jgi:metal-responsive CopG/Arc/MetJ family transcriptional regulator|nr:ribbon-helix-helix domain-containing protein [Chloroflexota bacterium]